MNARLSLWILGLTLALGGCGLIPSQSEYAKVEEGESLEVPPDLDQPSTTNAVRVPNATYSRVQGGAVAETAPAVAPESSTTRSGGALETGVTSRGGETVLTVADSPESTYRRLGFALERIGLKIEDDRPDERSYEVEYVDLEAREERPNVFARWILRRKGPTDHSGSYQVRVSEQGDGSLVRLFDEDDAPAPESVADEIFRALAERLQ